MFGIAGKPNRRSVTRAPSQITIASGTLQNALSPYYAASASGLRRIPAGVDLSGVKLTDANLRQFGLSNAETGGQVRCARAL
jgi:uncharacterized protein YjbI with pentapeptide repeats